MLARRAGAEHERHRADRARRVGRGTQRTAELLEHDRGVDHPHAGAAVLLGHQQADRADVAQAGPHVVVAEVRRVVFVRVAHVGDRRLVGEEAQHRLAQHLLVGTELEVHGDAPDTTGA